MSAEIVSMPIRSSICPYCAGTARPELFGGMQCESCEEVSSAPEQGHRICPDCFGEGVVWIEEEPYECDRCGCAGEVPVREVDE